jgi:hypothetical protein
MTQNEQAEAPQEGISYSKAATMDDEVVIVEEMQIHRSRGAKWSKLWPHRWGTFVWNRAMVLAAARSGVADYWKDTNSFGKLTATRVKLREAFWRVAASEVVGFDPKSEPLEAFLAPRSLWVRFQEVLSIYRDGKAYKAGMTETEWQSFLQQAQVTSGQPTGSKKFKTLYEYCTLLAWIPAGEDDCRYPVDAALLEQGNEVQLHLEVLSDAMEVHNVGVDHKKAEKGKEAIRTARKDAQSLAAER